MLNPTNASRFQPTTGSQSLPVKASQSRPIRALQSQPPTALQSCPPTASHAQLATTSQPRPLTASQPRSLTASPSRPPTNSLSRPSTASMSRPSTASMSRPPTALQARPSPALQAPITTASQTKDGPSGPFPGLPLEVLFLIYHFAAEPPRFVRIGKANTSNYWLVPKSASPNIMQAMPTYRDWIVTSKNSMALQGRGGAAKFIMYFNYKLDTLYLDFGYESLFRSTCLQSLQNAISSPELKRVRYLAINYYQGWGKLSGTAEKFAKSLAALPKLEKLTIFAHLEGECDPILYIFDGVFENDTNLSALADMVMPVNLEEEVQEWWDGVQRFRSASGQNSLITMDTKRVQVEYE